MPGVTIEKVREWANATGFPLEMAVAREFAKHDFIVTQSKRYPSPDEGRPLELDVEARKVGYTRKGGAIICSFLVECKKSYSPWVAFSADSDVSPDAFLAHRGVNPSSAFDLLMALQERDDLKRIKSLRPSQRFGFTLRTWHPTKNGKDSSRESEREKGKGKSWDKAEEATDQIEARVAAWFAEDRDVPEIQRPPRLCFPTIVVDGDLYEGFLGKDGNVEVEQVVRGSMMTHPTLESDVLVDIVTEDFVPTFAKEMGEVARIITEEAEAECVASLKLRGTRTIEKSGAV
jgi:hypothetical protein